MDFSDSEAREYISLLFDGYEKRKKEKKLYKHDGAPELIIKTYYTYVKKPAFDRLVYNFKRRYIYNENKMEQVHSLEEQRGLSCVYDYVNRKNDLENISIYDLSYIHEELYSKTNYPEFGGRYRKDDAYLSDTMVELTPHWYITHEMNLLKPEVEKLVSEGISLEKTHNVSELINYIDQCVILNCKLIKIHPFSDGNGRSVRAFMNLLFKLANIPPVYIENKEKYKYREAMYKALVEEDYTDIKDFYHFKICDSIMALDVHVQEKTLYADSDSIENSKELK